MNMARIAMGLACHPVGGVTVNRFCASGVTAMQMAADRIRVGEADVMIAGGAESMSMVPMGGNKPSFNPRSLPRRERGHCLRHGPDRREGGAAVEGLARGAGRVCAGIAPRAIAPSRPASSRTRSRPSRSSSAAQPRHRRVVTKTRTVSLDEGPRPDTSLEGLAKLDRVRRARQRHGGNSSQTSDGAGALILASEKAVKQFGLTPLARFVSYAARRAARDHGHRPDRGHSRRAALRRPAVPDIGWSS
jgi:acetyl-CoA acyltransferase